MSKYTHIKKATIIMIESNKMKIAISKKIKKTVKILLMFQELSLI